MTTRYFKEFPTIEYDYDYIDFHNTVSKFTSTKRVGKVEMRDLLIRHTIIEDIVSEASAFYEYIWQDEDRPETVAEKYYGSSDYYWIVLLSNQAYDPYYDFPLSRMAFDRYIIRKYQEDYGNLANDYYIKYLKNNPNQRIVSDPLVLYLQSDKSEVHHHWENGDGEYISEEEYFLIKNSTDSRARAVSLYEYEEDLNESKRRVRLIDRRYLPQIVAEADNRMRNINSTAMKEKKKKRIRD